MRWLHDLSVDKVIAHVHPDNRESAGVAARIRIAVIDNGEFRRSAANSRNGTTPKRVFTEIGGTAGEVSLCRSQSRSGELCP